MEVTNVKLIKRISLLPLILLFVLQVSAATYVASINSDVYHISSCGQAEKIKAMIVMRKNKLRLSTIKVATFSINACLCVV